jgi:hypothetical protein
LVMCAACPFTLTVVGSPFAPAVRDPFTVVACPWIVA